MQGTLTKNHMIFRKLHLGMTLFSADLLDEILLSLKEAYLLVSSTGSGVEAGGSVEGLALYDMLRALALCHNVTPATEEETGVVTYQAASPDEVFN